MLKAAKQVKVKPRLISFKATIQALRHWQAISHSCLNNRQETRRIKKALIDAIAQSILHQRLGRNEPQCVKRRPKPYQLMTQPRAIMREIPHRGKKHAKQA